MSKTTNIDGVLVCPLKQFEDERGKVMHMMSTNSPLFERFGEVYFSTVNSGSVKAWKLHRKMTQNITVPTGTVKLVIYDERDGSPTRGEMLDLELGEKNYTLVKIPPYLWYGFKGISEGPSLIANFTDLPHDPDEQKSADPFDSKFPYKW